MEVHVTPELEAKLTLSAAQKGRNPDELAQEILAQYLEEETRFAEAVQRGEDALQRGEYLTHKQVGQRLKSLVELCDPVRGLADDIDFSRNPSA
jgi:predicted transcriptional regulator